MKKTYFAPQTQLVVISTVSMLALSLNGEAKSDTVGMSRGDDGWDDED